MEFLIRLRHWQLFLLLFGLPLLMAIFAPLKVRYDISYISNFVGGVLLLLWINEVVRHLDLRDRVPARDVTRFRFFLLICFVFLVGFNSYSFVYGVSESRSSILIQLVFIFAFFACLWITAKWMKTHELKRPASIKDYLPEFILFRFFPFGVWVIQPKVNRLSKP